MASWSIYYAMPCGNEKAVNPRLKIRRRSRMNRTPNHRDAVELKAHNV